MDIIEKIENEKKLEQYNNHINKLEGLLKSVVIKGEYEAYRLTPCFMLFNFIDLLRGVATLDSYHIFNSGNIISRTMFEILVDFLYCETNRNNLYLRFGEYKNVSHVLVYNTLTPSMKLKINQNEYNKKILPKYNDFLKKYHIKDNDKKSLMNWSGKSLKNRVDIVSKNNPEIENLYYNIYKINCDYVHNYAGTVAEYGTLINNGITLNYNNLYEKDKFYLIKQINSLSDIFYQEFKKTYYNVHLADINF